MKKVVVGVAAFGAAVFGLTPGAVGLSFERFEGVENSRKESFISTMLHYYYYNFSRDPAHAYKAECMVDFNNDEIPDDRQYLYSFIVNDLDNARITTTHNGTVEGVIKAIIERECAGR
jgi:hypothetical protein